MLLRILKETFLKRKSRVALAGLSVLVGSTLAASLLTVASDITERVSRELRSYGANILVTPQTQTLAVDLGGVSYRPSSQDYIDEGELWRLKAIFWRNNILGFTPYLSLTALAADGTTLVLTGTWFEKKIVFPQGAAVPTNPYEAPSTISAEDFVTGVKAISPWWRVEGQWVEDSDAEGALVGAEVAQRLALTPGGSLTVSYRDGSERAGGRSQRLTVRGILTTGGAEDRQVFVSLPVAQGLRGIHHGVDRVQVSALTLPKEMLAPDIRSKKPQEMTPQEYEKWYCSPIIEAITTQIQEVLPGAVAKPVRQISEAEGSFAFKVQWLLLLVTGLALLASALGVMATMTSMVLERRHEIGLMKAIGAESSQVALLFLAEAAAIGLMGGGVGYLVGLGLARYVELGVFGVAPTFNLAFLPVVLVLALGVALLGSALPVRRAVRTEPVALLRGP